MALKKSLLQEIKKQSTRDEVSYAGLKERLALQDAPSDDVASSAFTIVQDILNGAEADTIGGLKLRLQRLEKVREVVLAANLDKEEESLVIKALTKVETAVKNHLNLKHNKLKTISNTVSKAATSFGGILMSATAGSPLMALAAAGISKAKEYAQQRKEQKIEFEKETKGALKRDAEMMFSGELKRNESQKTRAPLKRAPISAFDDSNTFSENISPIAGSGLSQAATQGGNDVKSALDNILNEVRPLEQISKDIHELVSFSEKDEIRKKDAASDALEASRELRPQTNASFGGINLKNFANQSQQDGKGGFLSSTLSEIIGTAVGVGGLGGALSRGKGLAGGLLKRGKGLAGAVLRGGKTAVGGLATVAGSVPLLKNPLLDKALGKTATSSTAKIGGKALGKGLLKKIPGVSILAGAGLGLQRALQGDFLGAGGEVLSGVAGTLPGLGTAASVGIDAALMGRDVANASSTTTKTPNAMSTPKKSGGFLQKTLKGASYALPSLAVMSGLSALFGNKNADAEQIEKRDEEEKTKEQAKENAKELSKVMSAGGSGIMGTLLGGTAGGVVGKALGYIFGDKNKADIVDTTRSEQGSDKDLARMLTEQKLAALVPLANFSNSGDLKQLLGDTGNGLGLVIPLSAMSGFGTQGSAGAPSTGSGQIEAIKTPQQAMQALAAFQGFDNLVFGGRNNSAGSPTQPMMQRPSMGGMQAPSMPNMGAPTEAAGDIGMLSAKYESGKLGSSAIGYDSTGGTSYGKYQIASKTGTMNRFMDFLKESNPAAYQRLAAAGPADGGKDGKFAQEWKALAKEGVLGNSEHEFIKKTHYDVGMKGVKDQNLQKMISNNRALQEVMWSTSVQHGGAGASGIFNKAFKEGMSEEDLVKAVYANRSTKFGSSTPSVQKSVMNRFADEQQRALVMLTESKFNKAGGDGNLQPTAPMVQASLKGTPTQGMIQPATFGGMSENEYIIDPDSGEKYYPDKEFLDYKQANEGNAMSRLSPDTSPPKQTNTLQSLIEKSQGGGGAQSPTINVVNNKSTNVANQNGGGSSSSGRDTGTSSRTPSFSKAIFA